MAHAVPDARQRQGGLALVNEIDRSCRPTEGAAAIWLGTAVTTCALAAAVNETGGARELDLHVQPPERTPAEVSRNLRS